MYELVIEDIKLLLREGVIGIGRPGNNMDKNCLSNHVKDFTLLQKLTSNIA